MNTSFILYFIIYLILHNNQHIKNTFVLLKSEETMHAVHILNAMYM
jgi:hypothetical protein